MKAAVKKFAVLGSPVAHSKSPQIHTRAYYELGLNGWQYLRRDTKEADFIEFITAAAHEYSGFSVTMPLKKLAAQIATEKCEFVRATGVANTLVKITGADWHRPQWSAYNTDIPGLQNALVRNNFSCVNALILGSGATALSAALTALLLGADSLEIRARRQTALQEFTQQLQTAVKMLSITQDFRLNTALITDPPRLTAPDLIINTLPADADVELPAQFARAQFYDVTYSAKMSLIAQRLNPAQHANGGSMLFEQALLQLRIFINGSPAAPLPIEDTLRNTFHGLSS
ncbi:hypothetical protein KJY78_01545 [Canibacter sp. lx-45]|uniref:shikimate dehydrogenase family protein n=1 Tax=Canibacter zhuwentaonis TaxID=2837491 RepID=UPI001BDD4983|nr:hypothetical protein [Canibacter zhuwentaonis]MBT1035038.1 hypothetical protein [Canibacter zhuwentaonis]